MIDTVDALLALARGDAARAVELAVPAGRLLVLTRQVAGEAQLAAGDRAGALRTATEIDDGSSPYCRAVAARLRGRAAGTVRQRAGRPERFAEAIATFDRLAMPFDAAVCRLDWAEAVGATTKRPRPRPSSGVWRSSTAWAHGPAADRARRLLRRLGRRPAARPRPAGTLSDGSWRSPGWSPTG